MALSPPVAADFALPAPTARAGALDTARRALLRHPTLIAGALTLVVILVAGVLAPLWWTGDPLEMKPAVRLRPPSAERWFGSDNFGRDIYTRTLYGSRISLTVGAAVSTLSLVLGTTLGLVVGFYRRLDMIAMRVMDGLMAIPAILLALALMALMKASVQNVIIALLIPEIPRVVRLTRASVLSLREHLMVEGARALGARTPRILARYVLPGLVAPLIVQGTYIAASAILFEAYLSFLGAGTPPHIPSWGNIMAEGRAYVQLAFWIILFPGIFLAATVLAINLVGDGLRDLLNVR
ncbi:MAG: peptide ABC transporter permease [Candidatus Rokubacteria bacterium 13_1_20CM_2_68_19]|nr:MAG: peptide ABC transporter permease [Candidatus Rokubacteria bacterium 13_2_20CM_2_64_8]OLC62969.1 MAG: peptide ABC transporter permease [Candidatus Rokubacteria bacterium 13_1_40CM_4_67_11]OLD29273.1 MAG: peptide ABC transporter permease [Candidatus Rokubacteria bacterium 13_1_40CM_2_68_13]OLD97861.1 MAG: peptide ABC transporter permease [Candidatus Rokubacteria bacterium 13_1_20CM_4_68_9]OLE44552.1 MAG: peptide ABC transporter permease [Candidatus Rokubacteria bacterium 13_1_20CM_2_68_19